MEIRLAAAEDKKQILKCDCQIHLDKFGAFFAPEQDADEIMYLKELKA